MASQNGGRWDVGLKKKAVHLERISDGDESLFDDLLEPDEARELAGLLTKFADKAEESDDSDEADDSDDPDDPDDPDEADDSDETEKSKKSEDSDKSSD
jgi:hypothetical protein